jgi:hypothetical protein
VLVEPLDIALPRTPSPFSSLEPRIWVELEELDKRERSVMEWGAQMQR